jgi:hypothetical protein
MRPTHRYFAASLVTLILVACSDSTEPGVGPPAKLVIQAGEAPQIAVIGEAVPTAPTVIVTDANNHPVPGVAVTFAITSGGGSLSSTTQRTNFTGMGSVVWTLGNTLGTNTLTAAIAGLPPVTFNATAILSDAAVFAFDLVDPGGDTLNTFAQTTSTAPAIDLLSLRGDFKRDSLILTATFSGAVTSEPGSPNFIRGYVEFDLDDDPSTGYTYFPVIIFYPAFPDIGSEYVLSLFGSDAAILALGSDADGQFAVPSQVQVNYGGSTVVVRVPMSLLGNDDGNFSIKGVIGPMNRPTDVFPNSGLMHVAFPAGSPSPWDYQIRLR